MAALRLGGVLHHVNLLHRVVAVGGHVLNHGLARLEELVLRRQKLVVDAMTVALLAPPLVRPDLPAHGQALVSWGKKYCIKFDFWKEKVMSCHLFSFEIYANFNC